MTQSTTGNAVGTAVVTALIMTTLVKMAGGRPKASYVAEALILGGVSGLLGPWLASTVMKMLNPEIGVGALPYGVPGYNIRRYGPQY